MCFFLAGVNFAIKQMGNVTKPTVKISLAGDKVTVKTMSTFKNSEISAKLGEEFDETTPDDRHVKVRFKSKQDYKPHLDICCSCWLTWDCLNYTVRVLAVNFHLRGRQTGASAEVGWQGDKICERDQGWEDGDGKIKYDVHKHTL